MKRMHKILNKRLMEKTIVGVMVTLIMLGLVAPLFAAILEEGQGQPQEPQYAPGEVIVKFKEGADPSVVLGEVSLGPRAIERVHSIKPAVTKFKKDYKLEKDSNGWYWFLDKNYKEVEEIPDDEVFREAYAGI